MRLIDADAIIRFLDNIERFEDEDRLFTFADVKKLIREAPTVSDEVLKESITEISAHPKTNGDRIRQMTDEELVNLLLWNVCNVCDGRGYGLCGIESHCKEHVAKWLKQEVSEDDIQ